MTVAMGPNPNIGQDYDEIPYPAGALPQTHPDHLRTMGILFGMQPAPVEHCRVLELGCADGSNLIPMAANLPDTEFVGVDLSKRQVASACELVAQVGLSNTRVLHRSIADVDTSLGMFDYIIAHGVFSWVPNEIQESMFEVCRRQLAPQGIAYISYNTNPGWRMRGMLRDMMIYHTARFSDVRQRVQQARALIRFLAAEAPSTTDPYSLLLKQELNEMQEWDDGYFRHDSLEDINDPIYFHEFVRRAADHGLRYLAESAFHTMLREQLSRTASSTLELVATDQVDLEQYMDFVRNRMFRQTLLCHQEFTPTRAVSPGRVKQTRVAGRLEAQNNSPDMAARDPVEFRDSSGHGITARRPLLKCALSALSERWPYSIAFQDLFIAARERLGVAAEMMDEPAESRALENMLLQAYAANLVRLQTWQPQLQTSVSDRPCASRLARCQAAADRAVTNQLHNDINLDSSSRCLLSLLDGSRDQDQLVSQLVAKNGHDAANEPRIDLARQVKSCLQRFGEAALLVG